MRTPLLLALVLSLAPRASAQLALPPDGGGAAPGLDGPADHLPVDARLRIQAELDGTLQHLNARGVLPDGAARRARLPGLAWPLRATTSDPGVHGVSNYVDLNGDANAVQDYTCGSRTYDRDDYDHPGIDYFTWPFGWSKMDGQEVQVVAAAPGTIIGTADGNDDRSCTIDFDKPWNAVYVVHDDGSTAWYGHLKNGSVTRAAVGTRVEAGDVLGIVGSSGASSGPHLHFELHDAQGETVEPHTGPCNPGASGWLEQRPYRDSAINALMTHSAAPGFASCPSTRESPHRSSAFQPGDDVITAAYYRDQVRGQTTTYAVLDPDGFPHREWSHVAPTTYNASYWYWTTPIPQNATQGTWTFTATYNGVTTTHPFTVGAVTVDAEPEPDDAFVASAFAPHPVRGLTRFTLSVAQPQRVRVRVLDTLGRELASALDDGLAAGVERTVELSTDGLAAGAYLVRIEGETFRTVRPLTVAR